MKIGNIKYYLMLLLVRLKLSVIYDIFNIFNCIFIHYLINYDL